MDVQPLGSAGTEPVAQPSPVAGACSLLTESKPELRVDEPRPAEVSPAIDAAVPAKAPGRSWSRILLQLQPESIAPSAMAARATAAAAHAKTVTNTPFTARKDKSLHAKTSPAMHGTGCMTTHCAAVPM